MTAREKVAEAIRQADIEQPDWASSDQIYLPLADAAIAAHLDALKTDGYAIVSLPERGVAGWPVDLDDDDFQVLPVHLVDQQTGQGLTGCRISWGAIELTLSPAHAGRLAGALLAALAAADAAEAQR